MGIAKIRSSFDVGAPVLTGGDGALITVLDAVLVNGYGTYSSLGWTKEFTGANKAVYKSSGASTNLYYRFDDTGTYSRCYVTIYESMTGIDTGSGLCGSLEINKGDNFIVFGDASRFWIFNRGVSNYEACPNTGFWTSAFMGNGVEHTVNNPSFVCGIGYINGMGADCSEWGNRIFRNFSFFDNSIYESFLHRKTTGELAHHIHFSGLPFTSVGSVFGSGSHDFFNGTEIYLNRPFVVERGSRKILGYLPGLYIFEHEPDKIRDALYVDTAYGFSQKTIDSKNYYVFRVFYAWPAYSTPLSTYVLINPNEDFL